MIDIASTPVKKTTEDSDTANTEVTTLEKGLSKDLSDQKIELETMETNEEQNVLPETVKKENLTENTDAENDDALLKQLDDALDDIIQPTEYSIKDLEDTKLLEKDDSNTKNETNTNPDEVKPVENEQEPSNLDVSTDDIDAGDLQIIDEVIEDKEEELLAEEIVDKDESSNVEKTEQPTEETPKSDKMETDSALQASNEEPKKKSDEETILLESDDEHNETVIDTNKANVSKRTINDEVTNTEEDEPPTKRIRSDDESSQNDFPSSTKVDEKTLDDPVVIDDADEANDKSETENLQSDGLLLIAENNRRRSDAENETDNEQTPKRTGSPLQDDNSYSDSIKRTKLSNDDSSDSLANEIEEETKLKENDELKEEPLVDESKKEMETSDIDEKPKTEPLNVQNIELSPKPEKRDETQEKQSPLSVEFLKTFKKSFQLMDRSDLEDFVLQKIVEAIISKSQVSDLRQKNEAHELTIANQRQRINDLSKQFRDLEMVHNRVVKDLETKSSGLVTPVKITRAVGLQVAQARAKNDCRPIYPQPNQRVPPFPSRSPQRPNGPVGYNALQTAQRLNVSLRQGSPNVTGVQFGQNKTPMRPLGQMNQSAQAKMIALQKQQALQRQQSLLQQQRVQAQALQRTNSGLSNGRSSVSLSSPGAQRSPNNLVNQILNNQQGSPVVLRKIVRPGPASVQQPLIQKASQKQCIDLTDEEDASIRTPPSVTATKIHVKSPATLNSSIGAPNIANGVNRSLNMLNAKAAIQRLPGNQFVQIAPKPNQPGSQAQLIRRQVVATANQKRVHPAPLPIMANKVQNAAWKRPPPRPQIRINNIDAGIVISWTIHEQRLAEDFDPIVKYQIYAYQETNQPPATESWRHVGDVKAMALPMAVTLTQFQEGQRYHFAVRAVDCHERAGIFSVPRTWDEKT